MNYEEMVKGIAGLSTQEERKKYLKTLKNEWLEYFKNSTNLSEEYIKEAWILAWRRYPDQTLATKFRICWDILWRNFPV
ncbi:MAG: hypothetical protein EU548_04795 [Promethearchaeota archaeon]|nr:MAG: hypothetical protein EU548_04795 [Candidatus Lokiarchaeota archaeon]